MSGQDDSLPGKRVPRFPWLIAIDAISPRSGRDQGKRKRKVKRADERRWRNDPTLHDPPA